MVEVLIAHPGGPSGRGRTTARGRCPKGEYEEGEDPRAAAHREFVEETGLAAPDGAEVCLGELRQPEREAGQLWALEATST